MNRTSLRASPSIPLLGCPFMETILERFQEGSVLLRQPGMSSHFQYYTPRCQLGCSDSYLAGIKPALLRASDCNVGVAIGEHQRCIFPSIYTKLLSMALCKQIW